MYSVYACMYSYMFGIHVSTYHVLKNIFGKSSNWFPNRQQAGSMTRWDISNAQQNVSSLCLLTTNNQYFASQRRKEPYIAWNLQYNNNRTDFGIKLFLYIWYNDLMVLWYIRYTGIKIENNVSASLANHHLVIRINHYEFTWMQLFFLRAYTVCMLHGWGQIGCTVILFHHNSVHFH